MDLNLWLKKFKRTINCGEDQYSWFSQTGYIIFFYYWVLHRTNTVYVIWRLSQLSGWRKTSAAWMTFDAKLQAKLCSADDWQTMSNENKFLQIKVKNCQIIISDIIKWCRGMGHQVDSKHETDVFWDDHQLYLTIDK
jgi:hypothetical protein